MKPERGRSRSVLRRVRAAHDDGFTLIELLIVVVILGILAGIVVFAVGSVRGDATSAACGHDRKAVETALEAHKVTTGDYPSSLADLGGAGGTLKGATISGDDLTTDEYTVSWNKTTNAVTCVGVASPGGGGGSTTGGSTTGGSTTGGSTTGGGPVDSVSPTTTAAITAGTLGLNGWRTSAVTLTLTATDAGTPTTGVSSITYRMTGATTQAPQIVNASTAVPTITADGTTTVFFHATDTAGNAETEKSFVVKVDQTAPVGLTVTGPGSNDKKPRFSGQAGISTAGSGDLLTLTVQVLNGAATVVGSYPATVNGSTGDWGPTSYGPGAALANGTYTARVTQSDAAGNTSPTVTLTWTA